MAEYGFVISASNLVSGKMKEIEESLKKMGVQAKVSTKEVAEDFEFMGERMTETFKNLKGLLLSGLGITALFEGWEFIEKSKEAFEGLEKAVTRVDTVLKSTKFAAGFSSEDIQNQAKELSKVITAKRDEILDAQGMLLSFHSIRGDTFKETTKVVADFATFYKEDMTQAALQVGKAVNDPLKGMNRLVRMGVEFSDTQKKAIKNYTEQGELVKAQAIILGELKTEFGGQAAAFALTDAGKIQVASKQWEELQFAIGEIVSKVEVSLIPSFTKIVDSIKTAFNSTVIQFFIEHIKDVVSIVLKLIPIWVTYRAIMWATGIATESQIVKNIGLIASMGSLEDMAIATGIAFEGFGAALVSTGIGALVVGLGLLVERLFSVNEEFDKSIQKISRLDELTGKDNPILQESEDAQTQFKYGKLDEKQKGLLFNSAKGRQESEKNAVTENTAQLQADQAKIADLKNQLKRTPEYIGNTENQTANPEYNNLQNTIEALTKEMNQTGGLTFNLKQALQSDTKITDYIAKQNSDIIAFNKKNPHHRKALIIDASNNPNGGVRGDSTNTSNLSGASGGLGQARIVHITVGILQQNNGVKESKSEADKAVRMITEALDNFSSSTNAQ